MTYNPSAPKQDTTYYNNPLVTTIDSYFKVNPAFQEPILSRLMGGNGLGGQLDFSDMGITSDFIQYSAIVAKSGSWINDRLMFATGDSTDFPAQRKAKMFGWNLKIRHDDLLDMSGGSGGIGRRIRNKIDAQVQANQGKMIQDMCRWCIGTTTTFASETQYDSAWLALLANKAATGTASDPEDICSTAGSTTAYAKNLTGTNKSKDFVFGTFREILKRFTAQRDSTTGEQMLKPSGNKFSFIVHPDALTDLQSIHPYNGVQDDENITYYDQIMKLGGAQIPGLNGANSIEVLPSFYVDAAYGATEDDAWDIVTVANLEDNFKLGTVVPYTVTDWDTQIIDGIKWHFRGAYQKVVPVARPFYISGSWKKAMHHGTAVYYNDAG